jgi:hypothetical protein
MKKSVYDFLYVDYLNRPFKEVAKAAAEIVENERLYGSEINDLPDNHKIDVKLIKQEGKLKHYQVNVYLT